MQKHRNDYLSTIRTEILRLEKCQKREVDSLSIKGLEKSRKEIIERSIDERSKKLLELSAKENDVLRGVLDTEISNTIIKNKADAVKPVKSEKKTIIKHEKNDNNYDEKRQEKDYNYFYKYFVSASETLPSYMEKNLAKMENNKGYFWRGILFLGNNNPKRGENNLFFEKKGPSLFIHDYSPTEYNLYEKIGQAPKKLIKRKLRKQKRSSVCQSSLLR